MNSEKILVIEDNADMRDNICEILTLAGYHVISAENGRIGVEKVTTEKPNLILCDIMMPGLDGYSVLHRISMDPQAALTPFVFLTAKADRSDMRKAMDLGADDYITKPFDDLDLLNAVKSRLDKSRKIKAISGEPLQGVEDLMREVNQIEDITKISGRASVKKYKKKEVVFSEGDDAIGLYFLKSGKVKVFKSHEVGKDFITQLVNSHEFFGFLPLLQHTRHTSSAEVLEDAEIVFFTKDDFNKLIYGNAQVLSQFVQLLSNRVSEAQERLMNLAYSSVRKRTAEALLLLKQRYSEEEERFSMSIARDDLARIVGTATESLIRTLGDFKQEGLILIEGSTITILDEYKLQHLRG
jgi:CRP-like cAMP-binding protein/CheY-like chemotaxis protein